ncbi:MAG: hypothetical protein WCO00_14655 [Rhodospirillaceae bacterium]
MPKRPPLARLRNPLLVFGLVLALALAPLAAGTPAVAADPAATAAAAKSQPAIDRSLVLLGCMTGLAIGTISLVLPPTSAWVAAGVWAGGLGTMIVRAGAGCIYGGLGGAVASLARALVRWADASWRAMKGRPEPRPLAIEGVSGS